MSAFTHLSRSSGFGALVGVVVMLVAFTVIDFDGWWKIVTIKNVVQFTAILGLIAMGQALVIMSKEIDLSVGSVYGITGVAFVTLEGVLGVVGSFVAALTIAASIGWIQGIFVVKGKLPSMIVTLAGLFTVRGIIYVWTGGTVRSFPEEARAHWLTRIFGGEIFGIEAAIVWLLILLTVLSAMLLKTPLGNRILATGGDEESALSRGVRTDRTKVTVFMMSAMLAGFAGIVTLADRPQTAVTLGDLLELEAIAAAVIGGCLLSGGRGSLLGAVLGAFIVVGFRYELIALGAPTAWFQTFVGIVLIAAVVTNQKLARMAGRNV